MKILPSSLQIYNDGPLFDTTWHEEFLDGKVVDEGGEVVESFWGYAGVGGEGTFGVDDEEGVVELVALIYIEDA